MIGEETLDVGVTQGEKGRLTSSPLRVQDHVRRDRRTLLLPDR